MLLAVAAGAAHLSINILIEDKRNWAFLVCNNKWYSYSTKEYIFLLNAQYFTEKNEHYLQKRTYLPQEKKSDHWAAKQKEQDKLTDSIILLD